MARDYRAEERRRNERARALGFSSRAQMRKALAKGQFTPQRNSRGTIIGRAPQTRPEPPRPSVFQRAGFDTEGLYRSARREAQQWSNAHSRVPASRYSPTYSGERFRRYYDAYINPATRANRIENGLASLQNWLVDEMRYYDADQFDDKYRPNEVS